jgi:hypothetical protein
MEFLEAETRYSQLGYPVVIFYAIGVIGFVLVFYRPYSAFLFSVFCLSARNFHAAVFTRTLYLGYFFNLNDLLLWIAVFASLFDLSQRKKGIWAPKILLAIFALIFLGGFQSLFSQGIEEEVLRSIWQSGIFPILFLVSTNMVDNEKRVQYFYWTLFFGALLASIQHLIFIRNVTSYELYSGVAELRTISYIISGGLFLAIGSLFTEPDKSIGRLGVLVFYFGVALIGLSYVLSLTRGLYVYIIVALLILPFLLRKDSKYYKSVYFITLIVVFALFITKIVFPNLELGQILNERFESFIYKDTLYESYETRWLGAQTEINLWLNSSIILGVGSSLPPEIIYQARYGPYQTVALSHVGFTTYLAHFGILGVLLYGIVLPVVTIRVARKYYNGHLGGYGKKIAVISIACTLLDLIGLLWSHHHLGATSHMMGLIYGATWGLHHGGIHNKKLNFGYNFLQKDIGRISFVKNAKYI